MSDKVPFVRVQYRSIEGYHIFTSPDVYGLYIASRDLQVARSQVVPALRELLHLNYAIKADVKMEAEFDEFVAHHRGETAEQIAQVAVPQETRYVLQQMAA